MVSLDNKNNKYAGFGIRLVAALIDGLILMLISSVLRRLFPLVTRPFVSMIIGALYYILLWVNWNGQTVGKRIMNIKIIKEDGKLLDYQTAVLRYLGYIISGIPLALGYFWVIWDSKKQGWHDKIAKTLVVKE